MSPRDIAYGEPFPDFQEALRFLENIPDYEKTTKWAYSPRELNLDRVTAVLDFLGNPQRSFRSIHLAGTKGKGSTAAAIASCLQEAGYSTALFSSPHLVSPTERMKVNREPVSEPDFCRLLGRLRNYITSGRARGRGKAITYFETLTALAFDYFREREVDWAVVEVGLGGRLDATNVLRPECCVITPVGFDHTDKLGPTIGGIAGEKAGILKTRTPVVLGRQRYPEALEVLRAAAEEKEAARWEVGSDIEACETEPVSASEGTRAGRPGWRFSVRTPETDCRGLFAPLLGFHQVDNCAAAVGTLELLEREGKLYITREQIERGLAKVECPARVQLLGQRPFFVLDTAHTVESVEALLEALRVHFPGTGVNFVFGCSAGKNLRGMLGLLSGGKSFTATQADSPRAVPAGEVAAAAAQAGMSEVGTVVPAAEAAEQALLRTPENELLCVTGSFFVAGEVWQRWTEGGLVTEGDRRTGE